MTNRFQILVGLGACLVATVAAGTSLGRRAGKEAITRGMMWLGAFPATWMLPVCIGWTPLACIGPRPMEHTYASPYFSLENFEKVRRGMTRDEVRNLIGHHCGGSHRIGTASGYTACQVVQTGATETWE